LDVLRRLDVLRLSNVPRRCLGLAHRALRVKTVYFSRAV
jgi:hypothetical protein